MADRPGSARRRQERRLRSMLRHDRQTVAMELAAALYHSCGDAWPGTYDGLRAQATASSGEEVENATHNVPRHQKTPPPGSGQASLRSLGHRKATAPCGALRGGLPTLGLYWPRCRVTLWMPPDSPSSSGALWRTGRRRRRRRRRWRSLRRGAARRSSFCCDGAGATLARGQEEEEEEKKERASEDLFTLLSQPRSSSTPAVLWSWLVTLFLLRLSTGPCFCSFMGTYCLPGGPS